MQFRLNKANRKIVAVIVVVMALVALSVATGRLNGIGVRRDAANERDLSVQSPLVPGVPFSVTWPTEPDEKDRSVLLVLHTAGGDTELEAARLQFGTMKADLACDITPGNGTLYLTELLSEKVLAQQEIAILPPGPDCAH